MIFQDDTCPVCQSRTLLKLNQDDFFECPDCHLQISFASFPLAAVLPMKGAGKFRATETKLSPKFFDALLAASNSNQITLADENSIFQNKQELRNYIQQQESKTPELNP